MLSNATGLPRISVLLPVRNALPFLGESVGSIRAQTFDAWELVIVDDGSTDGSTKWLRDIARADSRLRVFTQPQAGIVAALNRAVAEARGELFARMDADDIADPRRFGKQVQFLDANPNVGVLGTAIRRIGAARGIWQRPIFNAELRAELLFATPFAHPTVMIRRAVWARGAGVGYRAEFNAAEDVDLWERLAEHTHFANLPEPLLKYRIHPRQTTHVQAQDMSLNGTCVLLRWVNKLGLKATEPEQQSHHMITWLRPGTAGDLVASGNWLRRLLAANRTSGFLSEPALMKTVGLRWFEFCERHSSLGVEALRIFKNSRIGDRTLISPRRRFRFMLSCVLGRRRS